METKICPRCKIEKTAFDFGPNKTTKSGLQSQCKSCRKVYRSRPEVKQKKKTYASSYYKNNINYIREYRLNNRDKISNYKSEYYLKHKKDRREKLNIYTRDKMKNDLSFKLKSNLRRRLCRAIKGNFKSGSAINDLGCSVEEFKKHIEVRFYPNPKTGETMTWDNWTRTGWHMDHIKPLDSFDLSNRERLFKS